MFRFVEFIVRFREYVILTALIITSIAMMNLGNAGKLAGFRTIIISSIGLVQSAFAWLPNPLTIGSENAALRELNFRLMQEVTSSRRATVENQRLKNLLALRDTTVLPVVTAKIIGLTRDKARYYLTLNVGASDSIQAGMTVMNYNGLVGYVLFTSDNYAVVQTILDKNSRIAVMLDRKKLNGIMSWDNSETFWLKNIAKADTVRVGDELATSPYSSRYPASIPVGRVVAVADEANTLFQKIEVQPIVHFPSLEYVFVSRQQPDAERLLIEELLEKRMQKKPTR
jgi:rod shape-determining protein MreC